jgi:hypothetical protein
MICYYEYFFFFRTHIHTHNEKSQPCGIIIIGDAACKTASNASMREEEYCEYKEHKLCYKNDKPLCGHKIMSSSNSLSIVLKLPMVMGKVKD